jgi:hypothetical protein
VPSIVLAEVIFVVVDGSRAPPSAFAVGERALVRLSWGRWHALVRFGEVSTMVCMVWPEEPPVVGYRRPKLLLFSGGCVTGGAGLSAQASPLFLLAGSDRAAARSPVRVQAC